MGFDIIGPVDGVETFAQGTGIRELNRLKKVYGNGHWRKRKGFATIKLSTHEVVRAEIHWYEATGIGKREFKIKHIIG